MNGHYAVNVEKLTYQAPDGLADLYGFIYEQEDGSKYQSGPLFTQDELDAVAKYFTPEDERDVEERNEPGNES